MAAETALAPAAAAHAASEASGQEGRSQGLDAGGSTGAGKDKAEDEEELRQREEEAQRAAAQKQQLRQANLHPRRLDASELKSLDSSIKKNTAVIKKLRQGLGEDSREELLRDLRGLNLSRYVSEAVSAICEAKLKSSDIPAAVQVCSLLHQRYAEFTPLFIPALVLSATGQEGDAPEPTGGAPSAVAPSSAPSSAPASTQASRTARRRSAFRLLTELYLAGVVTETSVLVSALKDVVGAGVEAGAGKRAGGGGERWGDGREMGMGVPDREGLISALAVVVAFARSARVLLGLPVPKAEEEVYADLAVTAGERRQVARAVTGLYDAAAAALLQDHSALRRRDADVARLLATKGEVPEETQAQYEKARRAFEQLQRSTASLAEALDRKPPELPKEEGVTRVSGEAGVDAGGAPGDSQGAKGEPALPLWDDEETRSFYEDLPDLRLFVPAAFLGESKEEGGKEEGEREEEGGGKAKEGEEKPGKEGSGQEPVLSPSSKGAGAEGAAAAATKAGAGAGAAAGAGSGAGAAATAGAGSGAGGGGEGKSPGKQKGGKDERHVAGKLDEAKTGTPSAAAGHDGGGDGSKKGSNTGGGGSGGGGGGGDALEALLQRLPSCVNRALVDEVAVEFCYLNSRASRRKLVRALFAGAGPRAPSQLLPYYARLTATLGRYLPDVGTLLVQALEEDFSFLKNKKDQMNVEARLRNMRFLGELTKFKVAAPGVVFSCLKSCTEDFSGHNIDVTCALLETCGRFLLRFPETEVRMGNMLDIVQRLKNAKSLDPSRTAALDAAYLMCRPPERAPRVVKEVPPLHQYIKKLIFQDLSKANLEKVMRQMRRLPWAECEGYIVKQILKVHKSKFGSMHLLAALTAGMGRVRSSFSITLVDELMEDIRVGLETNEFRHQQRRLAAMRLLGELYSYKVVNSALIFDTCYFVLFFGVNTPQYYALDPPGDGFRIRLIIALLSTCGQFFDRGATKMKLDRFLLYLQNYVLAKEYLPLDVEFDLQDLYASLRPTMKVLTDPAEAGEALAQQMVLEAEEREMEARKERARKEALEMERARWVRTAAMLMGKIPEVDKAQVDQPGAHAGAGAGQGVLAGGGVGTGAWAGKQGVLEGEGPGEGVEEEERGREDVEEEGEEEEEGDTEPGGEGEDEGGGTPGEVKVQAVPVPAVDPEEEEAFERELRAMMQESLAERKLEKRVNTLEMSIPMSLLEGSRGSRGVPGAAGRGAGAGEGEEAGGEEEEGGGEKQVLFKMLVKKGGKQQAKALAVPAASALVQSRESRDRQEGQEEAERLQIKRRVLQYNERVGDEDNGLPPLISNLHAPVSGPRHTGSAPNKGPALTLTDVTSLTSSAPPAPPPKAPIARGSRGGAGAPAQEGGTGGWKKR